MGDYRTQASDAPLREYKHPPKGRVRRIAASIYALLIKTNPDAKFFEADLGYGKDIYIRWPNGGGLVSIKAHIWAFAHDKNLFGNPKLEEKKIDLEKEFLPAANDEIPYIGKDVVVHAGAHVGPKVRLEGDTVLTSDAYVGVRQIDGMFWNNPELTTGSVVLRNISTENFVQISGEGSIRLENGRMEHAVVTAERGGEIIIVGKASTHFHLHGHNGKEIDAVTKQKYPIYLSTITSSGLICMYEVGGELYRNIDVHQDERWIAYDSCFGIFGLPKDNSVIIHQRTLLSRHNDKKNEHFQRPSGLALLALAEPDVIPYLNQDDAQAAFDRLYEWKQKIDSFGHYYRDGNDPQKKHSLVARDVLTGNWHAVPGEEYDKQSELVDRVIELCQNRADIFYRRMNDLLQKLDPDPPTQIALPPVAWIPDPQPDLSQSQAQAAHPPTREG